MSTDMGDRPHIRLRSIESIDRDPLYEIHRRAMGSYVSAIWGWDEDIQREFWKRTAHDDVQVIEVDGMLAGFLDVQEKHDHIDIVNVELDPAVQGCGIGGLLIGRILEDAQQRGLEVRLQVMKVNPRARALYERLGFEDAGETATHYLMAWFPSFS